MGDAPLPHDLDAEGAVLSACLADQGLIDELRSTLDGADFYADANRRVWEAACAIVDDSRPVDAVTIGAELRERGRLEQVGGMPYLALLIDATPSAPNIAEHAKTVRQLSRRRRMIDTCRRIAVEGVGDVGDTEEWLQRAEQEVFRAAADGAPDNESSLLRDLVSEQSRRIDDRMAGREGDGPAEFAAVQWKSLREKFNGGWRRGKLHVVAGRPAMGKTAFAIGAAIGPARAKEGAVVISLEMTRDELAQRIISSEALVPLPVVMNGEPATQQWESICGLASELGSWPMSITHRPGAPISKIRSIVRREIARLKREFGVATTIVVVDYLQLIAGVRQKGDSAEQEISTMCLELTALAGELDVALLLLSQLNRGVESRDDKRPRLSDLRGSGSIEQDAYSVTMLYRDEYYHDGSSMHGKAEAIVAKFRNGATGTVVMDFSGECVRFDDEASAPDGHEDWLD